MTEPQWDGRPEASGAYMLRAIDGEEFPAWWSAASDHWTLRGGATLRAFAIAETGTTLVGPCLTPEEVAVREAARAEAMREACAVAAWGRGMDDYRRHSTSHDSREVGSRAASDIRKLPVPHADALSRALEAAEKRGMERALADVRRIADAHAVKWSGMDQREAIKAAVDMAAIRNAAALRARVEEAKS